jgi:hypothetical protein
MTSCHDRLFYSGKKWRSSVRPVHGLSPRGQLGISVIKLFCPLKKWRHDDQHNGSFTLATFVSKTVGDSNTRQYLPCPP